jgi:hypothetical protein
MKKNKMRLTLRGMAQSGLIWKLNTSFNFFCNETDNIKTMMDEAMVNKRILPLLLQAIFFMMQNVGILFQNCSAKLWNLAQSEATKFTYNQTFFFFISHPSYTFLVPKDSY